MRRRRLAGARDRLAQLDLHHAVGRAKAGFGEHLGRDRAGETQADDLSARLGEHVGIDEEFDVGQFRVVIPSRNVPPELLPAATGG